MAYVNNHRKWFGIGFLKKEILMDYISKSCDLLKKDIFDGLHKHFWEAFSKKLPKKEI